MTKDAFIREVRDAEAMLYHVSKSILKNDSDCGDAVQETLLKAYEKLPTLKKEKFFRTWITRILINECKGILRRRKNVIPYEDYMDYEDMIFGPLNYGKSKKEADQLAREALEELDLMHLKDRQNYKMSGGEKRMAAIATILAMNPKVMLMDEPSTALDPKNRRRLIRILQKLPTTKIIATHDLDLVLETCDRVLVLNQGKLVADGSVRDILWNRKLLEKYNLELPFCLAGIPERFQ